MTHWLQSVLGLSVDEAGLLVAVLALLVAIPAAVPPVRSMVVVTIRRMLLLSGATERRYRRWFLRNHGKLVNVYLNQVEELDLAQTYVSLSFAKPGAKDDLDSRAKQEERVRATQVLADPSSNRLLILGDPGSGKSTLLNAYGTGILRKRFRADSSDLKAISRSREIPFVIKLRNFAKHMADYADLADYIVKDTLIRRAHIPSGREFFLRLLRGRRCIVLLDGLDEVPDDRYEAVRDAILEFAAGDDSAASPKHARIVVSCRRQNFLRLQTDWIPGFDDKSYVLAPLLDPEIFFFISKRRGDFVPPRTPDAFYASIKNSGTTDLHRAPLILTISLGLYLQLAAYSIPRSVGKFYETMINELLTRHDFRGDYSGSTNKFNADDKYRFLREFALAMAIRPGGFEDFSFLEAMSFAKGMIPKMTHVRVADAGEFLQEIIDRSGLLTRTSDEDEYVFAHRSIQEYLIAVQLQRDPAAGAKFLLERASDSDWRQVAVFYAALDHRYVEPLLAGLAEANLELGGYCLAAAGPIDDNLSASVISRLSDAVLESSDVTASLGALVSVTGAQKETVREQALDALTKLLTSILRREDLAAVLGGDPEGALRLLQGLAETDSAEIAATVPALLSAISIEDERVVGVLWRCLAATGMENQAACNPIIQRLLLMVMQQPSLAELARQPGYTPSFATDELRAEVYPFEHALDRASNLVTLLCWARRRGVLPGHLNRYLEAQRDDPLAFAHLEQDYRRTIVVRPYRTTSILTSAVFVGVLAASIALGVVDWPRIDVAGPWYFTVPLYLAPGVAASLLAGGIAEVCLLGFPFGTADGANIIVELNWDAYYNTGETNLITGRTNSSFYWDYDTFVLCLISSLVTTPYAAVLASLVGTISLAGWLVVATIIIWLAFWLPATEIFASDSVLYVRKPSKLVDVYEDNESRHWIVRDDPGN